MQTNDIATDKAFALAHGMPQAQIDQIGTQGTQCDICGHTYAHNRLDGRDRDYNGKATLVCNCQECVDDYTGDY